MLWNNLQPETAEELWNFPAKPWEGHRSGNIEASKSQSPCLQPICQQMCQKHLLWLLVFQESLSVEKPALPTALHSCGARGCAKKRAGLSAPLPTSCLLVTPWQNTPGLRKLVAGTHKYVWVSFTPMTWLISNAVLPLSAFFCLLFAFFL